MRIISELISGILQIFIFTLLPLITYVVNNKKIKGFFEYIGITKPQKKTVVYGVLISVIFVAVNFLIFYIFDLIEFMKSPDTIPGEIRNLGFGLEAIVIVLIKSIVITGLSEEILFRGFIGKRLYPRIGFVYGNLVQALIFGLLHGLLLFRLSITVAVIMTLVSGIIGYLFGYLNERLGNGSIVPSWIAHFLGNTMSFSLIAFVL